MRVAKLLRALHAVKSTVRTGWMLRGVEPSIGETIAAHSFEASVLAYYLALKLREKEVNVNPFKASVLAVFHDLSEAFTGDIVTYIKNIMGSARKYEENIAREMLGENVAKLIREFNELESVEAKVARLAEVLATFIQGRRYLAKGYFDVKDVVENTLNEIEEEIRDEPLSKIAEEVEEIISEAKKEGLRSFEM